MRKAFAVLMTVTASLVLAAATRAQSPADALEEGELLGRWAIHCAEPASPGNPHLFFERAGDGAVYRLVLGPDRVLARQITAARFVPPSTVLLRIADAGTTTSFVDVTMLREGDRFRTMRAVGSDGKVHIDNGVLAANGQPSSWENRCN